MTETTQHLARIKDLLALWSNLNSKYVAALAHAAKLLRAEEVQLRRGWGLEVITSPVPDAPVYFQAANYVSDLIGDTCHDTPADAILAADAWVRENVDPKPKGA